MRKTLLAFTIFCLLFFSLQTNAQELNCVVTINSDAISSQQVTDQQVFSDMKNSISDFMNNKRWTSDIFAAQERIKCNLTITITKSPQQNVFAGTAQFQIIRPIFGTTSETPVLTYVDNSFIVSFLPEDRSMLFNEQSYSNNLTSILGFYALFALGVDYDTFSKLGGTAYYQRAYNVANFAANASQSGWQQSEGTRNRYWLIENFQNQQLQLFREGLYNYHRLALDNFTTEPANGRKLILDLLATIKGIQSLKSTSAVVWYSFFDAKDKELVNIFSEAPKDERQKAFNFLSALDPAKTETYRRLAK